MLTASIVLFQNKRNDLVQVINSFLGFQAEKRLILVDNSSTSELSDLAFNEEIIYIKSPSNLGFGKAHNIALREAYKLNSIYHLLLNPDISFKSDIINRIVQKMDNDKTIGLISPKVKYPNQEIQYLCKLLPSPFDLIMRRFIPIEYIKRKSAEKYELRFFGYDQEFEPPSTSGCFMFIRTEVLKKISGFDERFFMYMEDVDITRRIREESKVLFYPEVHIIHKYEKGSYKNKKLLIYHLKSAIQYFNKWGWIFDHKRKKINLETLEKLGYKKNHNSSTT